MFRLSYLLEIKPLVLRNSTTRVRLCSLRIWFHNGIAKALLDGMVSSNFLGFRHSISRYLNGDDIISHSAATAIRQQYLPSKKGTEQR